MELAEIRREQSGQFTWLMIFVRMFEQHCSRQNGRAVDALTPLRLVLFECVRACVCVCVCVCSVECEETRSAEIDRIGEAASADCAAADCWLQ